jgi:hypothetical protein
VICALVANRLSAPSPLYDVAGWASSAALAELFEIPAMLLNDDRLGRALEALAAARAGGADLSRLHLDLTAVRFAGAYEHSAMVEKGWAADRSIGRQVKTLQASTVDGVPVYYRPRKLIRLTSGVHRWGRFSGLSVDPLSTRRRNARDALCAIMATPPATRRGHLIDRVGKAEQTTRDGCHRPLFLSK